MEEQAFQTNNRPLAFALACAGCEFAGPELNGPAVNDYSVGFLKQPHIKRHWKGEISAETAAKILIEKGIPGNVTYLFRRCPILAAALAAWDQMAEEFQLARAEARGPIVPNISPTVVAQVLFVGANSQKEFEKIPFLNRMSQLISSLTGKTSEDEGGKVTVSGFGKVRSIFGSPEVKNKLGL